jgi:DNA-binding NarL/FixJ family response regulator
MPIRVLLADDTITMRRVIRHLLAKRSDLEVVGETEDFAQAMQLTSDLKPDIVLLDLHMPRSDGIAPTDVKSLPALSGSRLLAISMWNDADSLALADNLGAAKLLNKMELAETLVPAIFQLALPHHEGHPKAQRARG